MVPDYSDSAPPLPPSGLPRKVHIVGIGGAGMAALAEILQEMGHSVQGSDLKESSRTQRLQDMGIQVFIGHHASQTRDAELVVRSTAIPESNPELQAAQEADVPVWSRWQLLEALSKLRRVLAVAGSHGKTTVTSMLSMVLVQAGLRPSFLVGGDLNEIGSGACWDASEWFVVEADESDGSFLSLSPEVSVVTSMDADHHTRYAAYSDLCESFISFLETVSGTKILHHSVVKKLESHCAEKGEKAELAAVLENVITYGEQSEADFRLDWQGTSCSIYREGRLWATIELAVPGRHNAENAVAALIAANELGVSPEVGTESLQRFAGVSRRFEFRGTHKGATFIDDYAHHPVEIASAIAAAQELEAKRIICVFQPHRYSRTKHLWQDFGPSFAGVDCLMVCDIYASDEMPLPGVTGDLISNSAAEANPDIAVMWLPQLQDVANALEDELRPGDLCLVLGAGDVHLVIDEVIQNEISLERDSISPVHSSESAWPELGEEIVENLAANFALESNWPLGRYTTYRVGGSARFSILVKSRVELGHLASCLAGIDIPILVLGKGSNMLVSDNGFDGLVIRLGGDFNDFEIADGRFRAGGLCALPTAARRTAASGLAGFEWAVGVPGTVGGGVRMNAGCHGSDISDSILTVTCFDMQAGVLRTITAEDLELDYRTSAVRQHEVICDASFALSLGDPAASRQEIAEILRWRRENQPGGQNCGSVFRNPASGPAAGFLIEQAGLKGHRHASAQISQKHANFIISDRDGSAEDVLRLMCQVADDIEEKNGIRLQAETVLVGFGEAANAVKEQG